MVNSGTEAVMSALRLARGATGRDKIVKFEGCYHGHSDCMLVKAGSSAVAEGGKPSSAGVPLGTAKDNPHRLLQRPGERKSPFRPVPRGDRLYHRRACGPPTWGWWGPTPAFCRACGTSATGRGALLIFDEVITGFRLAKGGAGEYYGVRADLVTFGKIIGGGMPVGAYGGSRALMEQVAPCGPVYQAGTLSGNPVAMAAGLAQLTYLDQHPEVYTTIAQLAERLAQGMRPGRGGHRRPGAGSTRWAAWWRPSSLPGRWRTSPPPPAATWTNTPPTSGRCWPGGVYLAPAQFEAMFVSYAHTQGDIDQTVQAAGEAFARLYR